MKTLSLQDVIMGLASIQPNGNEEKSLPLIKGRRMRNKTYYATGLSSDIATNAGEVLLPSTINSIGLTNFPSGGQLPKGSYFFVTGIRVLYDTTVTDPKLGVWASNAPVAWKNGEITLGQDGQPTLFEAPGTDVSNFKASTGNDDDFREISGVLFQPQKRISIKGLTAGTPPACVVKFELRGYELFEA